jgi:hypothetical protein
MSHKTLCKYNGLSRCSEATWDSQQDCDFAEKSPSRNECLWMRPKDGTCSHPAIAGQNETGGTDD